MKNKQSGQGNVLSHTYVEKKDVRLTSSLFWNDIGQSETIDRNFEHNQFFLFLSEVENKNSMEFHRKRISTGISNDIKRLKTLQVHNDSIKIYPTYFKGEAFETILEIIDIQSIKGLKQQLEWLVQQKQVEIKICCNEIDDLEVQYKLDKLLKYTKTMQTGQATFVERYYATAEEKVEAVISKYLSEHTLLIACRIFIKIREASKITLFEYRDMIKKRMIKNKVKLEYFTFRQKIAIEHFYLSRDDSTTGRMIMLSNHALSMILPIADLGLFDVNGKQIGYDHYNNPVFFDIWHKTNKRVNSNFIILGQSGQGKTTLLKTILHCNQEDTIFLLDPENEYDTGFEKMKNIVYEVEGNNYFSDIFEFKANTEDAILFVNHHFCEKTKADYESQQLFSHYLQDYTKGGGETLTGFHTYLQHQEHVEKKMIYYIESILQRNPIDISEIEEHQLSRFILKEVIDIASENTTLLLYEMLYAIWKKMVKSKEQRKFLVIDESYLLFSRGNYIVAELLRNIIKRARKYNISVGIISQNIVDFNQPEITHLLSPIFDTCTYKFLFFQGEKDFEIVAKLCRISDVAQVEFMKLRRGECMLVVGTQYGKISIKEYV